MYLGAKQHIYYYLYLIPGQREVLASPEGVPVFITATGGNGEEHHRFLPGSREGQSHHQLH